MVSEASKQHELEYRLHQQALLAELGRRALADMPLDDLLEEAARLTALGMQTQFCKVLEYQPAENRLLVRAGVGWDEGVVGVATVGADLESPAGYALHTGKPVISNNLSREERFRTPALLTSHRIERAINVILTGEGKPFGVLEADSRADGAFSEHDIDFLQAVANLLGMAIERRRALEALKQVNATLEERVATEVAERRQAEAVLHQAQKMEAVGQLTGGVAHDFNNLLTVISGSLDLIAGAVTGNERLERLITAAQKGALRGAQLTGQLLAFARRQTLRPETRGANELVREFDVLASRILGEAVELKFDLAADAGTCHVDPAQFGAALLNLIVNARDALPNGGGRLAVRTGNADLDARQAAKIADAVPGAYVTVAVEDNGVGMPPEVLDRALEPFFTTKDVGKGTGLGLSQVYGFARQSGGFLTLDSAEGSGTTVTIYLPRMKAESGDVPAAPDGEPRGSETVLVVEDDGDVRNLVVDLLTELGYATRVARNAPEALDVLRSHAPVHLVMTDVVMPGGMSGVELAREIRRQWPGIKLLLTSGYTAGDRLVSEETGTSELPLLSKPYQRPEFARRIREVLGD